MIRRIAARCDSIDRAAPVRVSINGRWQHFPLGVLHDAYEGHGAFEGASATQNKIQDNVVATFGSVLAKLDTLLDNKRSIENLGAAMNALSESLNVLMAGHSSGFPVMFDFARTDQLVVELSGLQQPATVVLFGFERVDGF